MKLKKKISTIAIILTTVILAGVAIFTAIRLYQLRNQPVAPTAPTSQPRAAEQCSLTFTLTPETTTPTIAASCRDTTPIATVTWTGQDPEGYVVDVNDSPNAWTSADGFWHKYVLAPETLTTVIPDGFTNAFDNSEAMPGLVPKDTYYVRVFYRQGATYSETVSFTALDCVQGETPSPTPTGTPGVTPTPTGTPGPSATPNQCGGSCGSNANCASNLVCYNSVCRNPSCTSSANCVCGTSATTPTPVPTLPESGTDWPTILGAGVGILVIIGSLLLAL